MFGRRIRGPPPMTVEGPAAGRPPLSDPAILLATWFGAGYLPTAPGTWGSLAALPVAWLLSTWLGWPGLAAATAVVFLAGVWSAGVYARRSGIEDPRPVVIDEVAGQWVTLMLVPPDPLYYGLGFLLFRLFDIVKPWPVSWADRSVGGGLGIMLDDVLAGAYGVAVMLTVTAGLGAFL